MMNLRLATVPPEYSNMRESLRESEDGWRGWGALKNEWLSKMDIWKVRYTVCGHGRWTYR